MRILHTADWHLNSKLGHISRNDDIRDSLRQIRDYLEQHKVDVLLVAGDVIEKSSTSSQIRDAVQIIKEMFLPFVQRGGHMIVISGNHDDDQLFDAMNSAMTLSATAQAAGHDAGNQRSGRLHLVSMPKRLDLADANGCMVQFVLMPYPEVDIYLRGEDTHFASSADKHQKLQAKFYSVLEDLKTKVKDEHPAVLVSHIHVRGAQAHTLYKITESDDVVFEPDDIPDYWAYAAYGHIHRAQIAKAGADHVRYAGSVQRMDIAERDDDKQVVLVEIEAGKRTVTPLPLQCRPVYAVVIDDPDSQIATLAETYPDFAKALVTYTLQFDPARHNIQELCQKIEAVFPFLYGRKLRPLTASSAPLKQFEARSVQDVSGTVREYLAERLKEHPDRADLLALAETVMAEEVAS